MKHLALSAFIYFNNGHHSQTSQYIHVSDKYAPIARLHTAYCCNQKHMNRIPSINIPLVRKRVHSSFHSSLQFIGKSDFPKSMLKCMRKLQTSLKQIKTNKSYLIEEPCLQCFVLLMKNPPDDITKEKRNMIHFMDGGAVIIFWRFDLDWHHLTSGNTEDCNCIVLSKGLRPPKKMFKHFNWASNVYLFVIIYMAWE